MVGLQELRGDAAAVGDLHALLAGPVADRLADGEERLTRRGSVIATTLARALGG